MRLRWIALIAVAIAACSGSSHSSTPERSLDPFATARSSGAPPTTAAPPAQLAIGNCFNTSNFAPDAAIDASDVQLVPCEGEHQHEVYAVEVDPADGAAPFPGDAALAAFADDRCLGDFTPAIGADYKSSHLDIALVAPTADEWNAGSRAVVCTVHDTDFALRTGSVLHSGQ